MKLCSQELAKIFTRIYQLIIDEGIIPRIWKSSIIIPVPKVTKPTELNHYRPIALTSNAMKCFERLLLRFLKDQVNSFDQTQFAYQNNRSVEDAVLVFLHSLYQHLETPKSYVRSVFIDFSSAFNTIVPHLLIEKLLKLNVAPKLAMLIHNFLVDRPQWVQCNNVTSCVKSLSLGAPQGCVISPILFSLYTSDCSVSDSNCAIIKYADDTVISGFLQDDVDTYFKQVERFVDWCDKHYLVLNVNKTKEMIFDFRRSRPSHKPLVIHDQCIEQVSEYKYLGVVIDEKLNWNRNSQVVASKASQRLYFLRKLREFHVDNGILVLFYHAVIQSVLMFNFLCTFGNLSQVNIKQLERPRKIAQKITRSDLPSISTLYEKHILLKVHSIMCDPTHPLHFCLRYNRSGVRLCVPKTMRCRFRQSFIPNAIHFFNKNSKR